MALPDVPLFLKSIRPYVKVGMEVSRRDPVTSYYCHFYALQTALKTNYKSSSDAKTFLFKLMDFVENEKSTLKKNPEDAETVSSDIAGHAVVESAAMKLFVWADTQDRACNFNKSVVKAFYTASLLFDVLEVFDEPMSDEAKTHRKYARWKATYIHNCLKNNETPIPGPIGGLESEIDQEGGSSSEQPSTSNANEQSFSGGVSQNYTPEVSAQPRPAPRSAPVQTPELPTPSVTTYEEQQPPTGGPSLSPSDLRDAEKLCKFAASALQYEDVPTAINNLEKCLKLLRPGGQ